MKALLVSAAAVGLLTATPAFAQAGNPDSAQGSAAAEIVAPISVEADPNGGTLNFGRIVAGAGAQTVTVDGAGTRTGSIPANLLGGITPSAALFNVTGEAGLGYNVTVDPSVTMGTMTASLLAYPGDGYSLVGGSDSFTVGGTLSVGANQTAGTYTGTFNVQVQYN